MAGARSKVRIPGPSQLAASIISNQTRRPLRPSSEGAILRRSPPALAHHVITATRCEPSTMGVRFWGPKQTCAGHPGISPFGTKADNLTALRNVGILLSSRRENLPPGYITMSNVSSDTPSSFRRKPTGLDVPQAGRERGPRRPWSAYREGLRIARAAVRTTAVCRLCL